MKLEEALKRAEDTDGRANSRNIDEYTMQLLYSALSVLAHEVRKCHTELERINSQL